MSQSIQISGFDKLDKQLDAVATGAKEKRREIHEKIGQKLKSEVDRQIKNRIHDSHGKIRSWQKDYNGSGGGYTAVRPIKGKNEHGYAYGHITNALENGHPVRVSRRPGYKSTSKRFRVVGYGFYAAARTTGKRLAYEGADELARWVKHQMEGNGG